MSLLLFFWQVIGFFSTRLEQAGSDLSVERVQEVIMKGAQALPKDRLKVPNRTHGDPPALTSTHTGSRAHTYRDMFTLMHPRAHQCAPTHTHGGDPQRRRRAHTCGSHDGGRGRRVDVEGVEGEVRLTGRR